MSWSGYIPGSLLRDVTREQVEFLMGGNSVTKDIGFYQAAYEIGQARSWDSWFDSWGGVSAPVTVAGMGNVRQVEKQEDPRDDGGWGEYSQGSTGEISMTFEVKYSSGDLRYFRKYGEADSYGRESWNGRFVEVRPEEKPVTVYAEV